VFPTRRSSDLGFTLDGNGEKMSKSIGNIIDPNEVIKKMGAEIIRLWVSTVDTSADVRVSMDILSQTSETYRKIRNTMRFLLANTTDFNHNEDAIAYDDLTPRSEEHTSELQSRFDLVCRLLLEKKKNKQTK